MPFGVFESVSESSHPYSNVKQKYINALHLMLYNLFPFYLTFVSLYMMQMHFEQQYRILICLGARRSLVGSYFEHQLKNNFYVQGFH